jgi:hypothetical protein
MSKTLQDISFESIAQEQKSGSSLGRLFFHTWRALGLFTDTEQKILSRIYLAYVIGWLMAVVRYRWNSEME